MPCRDVVIDGRVAGIVCGPRTPRRRCPGCGRLADLRLCDGPRRADGPRGERDCSRRLCRACMTPFGPRGDLDLCPPCAALWDEMAAGRDAGVTP